jgi:hypothetical protein
MAEVVRMRRFKEPVVAAPPTGVRIRTRIHMTDSETAAMTAIGTFLGTLYRAELAEHSVGPNRPQITGGMADGT